MKLAYLPFCPLLLVACSSAAESTTTGTGPSGVTSTQSLTQLTDDEIARLCDWMLATEGGAGKITKCPGGSERETHTRERCIESLKAIRPLSLRCTITVGDAEQCSLDEQKDTCAKHPSCDKIKQCVNDG